jgi:hypothetical protein
LLQRHCTTAPAYVNVGPQEPEFAATSRLASASSEIIVATTIIAIPALHSFFLNVPWYGFFRKGFKSQQSQPSAIERRYWN